MIPWKRFCQDWRGKKVLVMGLGLQGRGVGDTKIFLEAGARVTVTDVRSEKDLRSSLKKLEGLPIRFTLGRHEEEDFRSHDMVLRNPDVPAQSPFLKIARGAGIPIKMDSSLFARYCPFPIVGVTGTRGKTTTTMMMVEVLRKFYRGRVYLGGNIPGKATLELLKEVSQVPQVAQVPQAHTQNLSARSDPSLVILELSSWELQGWRDEKISPHIAIFTNFYEDHLNRYASMKEYFQDKLAILQFQKKNDWAILNADNPWTKKAAAETNARIKWFCSKDLSRDVLLRVPGKHNRANAAAALATLSVLGVEKKEGLELLERFGGVPSRLETIATIDGVEYINDTTSTTPAAGIAALRAMRKPVILIAGGSSKNLNLKPFADEILSRKSRTIAPCRAGSCSAGKNTKKGNVKYVILLKGEGTDELISHLKTENSFQKSSRNPAQRGRGDLFLNRDCHGAKRLAMTKMSFETKEDGLIDGVYDDFKAAVCRARKLAHPGDAVLLSPGCASFSMFPNEFQRGDQFNHIVRQWQKEKTSL